MLEISGQITKSGARAVETAVASETVFSSYHTEQAIQRRAYFIGRISVLTWQERDFL